MSWLFKASPPQSPTSSSSTERRRQVLLPGAGGGGLKEDLPEIGRTIGRQQRGVTSFVSPLPDSDAAEVEMSPKGFVGIRNDLAEIGGSLKSGLSKLRSSLLPFRNNPIEEEEEEEEEDEEEYAAGITEEVISFVEELATRPECWTDFPLPIADDFRMSDAHREHALAIAEMVPSLAALKANLHSSVGGNRFWLIYFILLLPRLGEQDREILSSSQIVETRNMLLKKIKDLRNQNVPKSEDPGTSTSCQNDRKSGATEEYPSRQFKVTEIEDATQRLSIIQDQEETWLEGSDIDSSTCANFRRRLDREEDLSYSDLEDDDSDRSSRVSASSKLPRMHRTPSGSSDWVQLQESATTQNRGRQSFSRDKDSDVESTEWLKVDEFD